MISGTNPSRARSAPPSAERNCDPAGDDRRAPPQRGRSLAPRLLRSPHGTPGSCILFEPTVQFEPGSRAVHYPPPSLGRAVRPVAVALRAADWRRPGTKAQSPLECAHKSCGSSSSTPPVSKRQFTGAMQTQRDAGLVRALGPSSLAASIVSMMIAPGIFVVPTTLAAFVGSCAPGAFPACAGRRQHSRLSAAAPHRHAQRDLSISISV